MVPTAEEEFFFSEEKKRKTFMSLSRFSPAAYAKETKVFWFSFSKKNCFPAARAARPKPKVLS
jgi:hypothetical protein